MDGRNDVTRRRNGLAFGNTDGVVITTVHRGVSPVGFESVSTQVDVSGLKPGIKMI